VIATTHTAYAIPHSPYAYYNIHVPRPGCWYRHWHGLEGGQGGRGRRGLQEHASAAVWPKQSSGSGVFSAGLEPLLCEAVLSACAWFVCVSALRLRVLRDCVSREASSGVVWLSSPTRSSLPQTQCSKQASTPLNPQNSITTSSITQTLPNSFLLRP